VAGVSGIQVDEEKGEMRVGDRVFHEGDWLSLDGTTGRVMAGELPLIPATPDDPDLIQFMSWVDRRRSLRVRANADIPRDATQARRFGAEGIGLCRTEHMFFNPERILAVRQMIISHNEAGRRTALARLLPFQREDFRQIFTIMAPLPVTIRLLDPPLHEFLPHADQELQDVADSLGTDIETIRRRAAELAEANPMLGHRGVRLGVTFPEIYEMQVRAIFEGAVAVAKETGKAPHPEIMIPLVGMQKELELTHALVDKVAAEVFAETGTKIEYTVGTMIELPRAAILADKIAEAADFFSFGTNDLTQTMFGLSRDDAGKFLPFYVEHGILPRDPFVSLDLEGVGECIRIAAVKGRSTKPELKMGICGEHGGDPASIHFCEATGLDYVSCSPYRVPVARLAAAQATLGAAGDRTV